MSYLFDDASQLDIYQNSAERQRQEKKELTEVQALEWPRGRIPLEVRRANFLTRARRPTSCIDNSPCGRNVPAT